MKLTLYKREFFITEKLYISTKGHISSTLLGILDSLKDNTDILVEDEVLIEFMNLIKVISPDKSIILVRTNADFMYNPIPKDFIKDNELVLNIGSFISSKVPFDKITQIAFKYNNLIIRIGTKI